MNQSEYEELRKQRFQRLSVVRELLASPPGQAFLRELRDYAYNPPGGVYVPGSFDRTAFHLGAVHLYEQITELAKGMNDDRTNST
jgi:hypothetical protein